jgi:hypothetical protein
LKGVGALPPLRRAVAERGRQSARRFGLAAAPTAAAAAVASAIAADAPLATAGDVVVKRHAAHAANHAVAAAVAIGAEAIGAEAIGAEAIGAVAVVCRRARPPLSRSALAVNVSAVDRVVFAGRRSVERWRGVREGFAGQADAVAECQLPLLRGSARRRPRLLKNASRQKI